MKKALIFFADGTEECEALIVVDLFKRAELDIKTVSVMQTNKVVTSHGLKMETDDNISTVSFDNIDMLILPGGIPGTINLKNCKALEEKIIKFDSQKKHLAAICAAPIILGELGLLKGKNAICYPSFEDSLIGANVVTPNTFDNPNIICDPITDGHITTASGLGHTIPFGLELIKILTDNNKADEIANQIGWTKNS